MDYFASLTLAELTPILGILAGMLAAFYAILKFVLNNATKTQEADRDERKEFTKTLKDLTKSNERIAQSHEKAAQEAEKRNGHLAELTIEARKDIMNTLGVMLTDLKDQNVKNQVVDHYIRGK